MKQNYYTARHFIMIPFEDENFITSYEDLCSKLKSENPEHFDPELLQKPSKLHISALIFDLKEDPVKVNKVCDIMKELQDDIKNIAEGEVTYKFGGYGVFDSYQKCRVIYSKMEEDTSYTKMEKIIDLFLYFLYDYLLASYLSDYHLFYISKIDFYNHNFF